MSISGEMNAAAVIVEKTLELILPAPEHQPYAQLLEAMRYSTFSGGKRLRPYLCLESAKLFGVDPARARRAAAAIEMVHCYSLIHDDLPAMDNANLRRGKPTVHKQYDEATAILAGDALQAMAFEILADSKTHDDPFVRCELVAGLAKAAGVQGMCGGQMFDMLEKTNMNLDAPAITRLQRMKTGAMIAFSCEAGAILGKASQQARTSLYAYANDMGLAYQITDDLLDVTGERTQTGKDVKQDNKNGKVTFVSIMGVDGARQQARRLSEQAVSHLADFGAGADGLRATALALIERKS
jgi:farnesyl diphosphate synthase